MPLITPSESIGWLTVGCHRAPLTGADLRILSAIADITANAVHRAALHEKTEQRLQHLSALQTIDQAIKASLDLRFTLNTLLDQVISQLRVDATDILLHNSTFQTFNHATGRGFRTKEIERLSLRLGESYAGKVALERRTISRRNLAQFPERIPRLADEGFVSYAGVPLIVKGKVKGVLEVFHRAPFNADSEWLSFLEMLASQAAIAIDNAQLFEQVQRSNLNLILSYDATIEGWSRALDLRDHEAEGHARQIAQLTEELARAAGIDSNALVHIRRGALLHDIGKIAVPDNILYKPGALTEEEWRIMQRHPETALKLLEPIPFLQPALDIPYCHHEKWNGSGYPRGLKGEDIPIAARVFALVDVWDALRSERPYRAAWSDGQAREHIGQQAGKHFDPNLTEHFLRLLK